MSERLSAVFIILAASLLTVLFFGASLLTSGERTVSPLENIHGLPYPAARITEKLAHADIYLREPVLAHQLNLTITFNPRALNQLSVGIRENEFWLSYRPTLLFNSTHDPLGHTVTRSISIPLSDKFAEKDRSLDLMFFADGSTIDWELINLQTNVTRVRPTGPELKDYLRSIIKRERAL